jgi:flagellar basal body-associated protein FliL
VTYRSEDDVEYETEEAPRRGRRWISIIVILALAATGSASAFLWRAYGNNFPTFPSFGATPAADAGDKVIVQKDLQAFQQQITAQTQAATQLLGSQQAEIKRLSEQMTGLATKLDTLQRSVTSLQVTAPIPSKPAPIPMPPVRKKPVAPKPAEEPAAEAPPSPSPLSR